ncbi:MAG: hypothetical protein ACREMA_08185 [Longimicrobiales bacterium]
MRVPLLISSAALFVPLTASSQVVEHDRMPRGYNKHPVTVPAAATCPAERDRNSVLNRLMSRTDPIPNYGWVWVTVDAIKNLEWPRAAGRVERFLWGAILTPAQRDSIRAFEGTPVAVDGYLLVDYDLRRPGVATEAMEKASRGCNLTGDQVNYHFWLTPHRDQSRADAIPITVTPQMRQQGWDLAKLDDIARHGRMVRVWGWLLFDQARPDSYAARSRQSNTVTTPWQVYPIVEIEVFHKRSLVPLREWEE